MKKSGIKCKDCGYELLIVEDKVICQNCKKRIIPNTYKPKWVRENKNLSNY